MPAPPFTMPDGMQIAKAVAIFVVVTIVAPLVTAGTALAAMFYLPFPAPELPDPKPSVESRVTHVFDATGAEIGVFRRFDTSIPVEQKDIPEILKQAVVAAEDKRFYSHGGFDLIGAMRAAWADFRGKTVVQGGSTITQQYVKKVYTGDERTLARKIREAVLAGQLDRKVTKDEILYRYLNTIYFGGGAYGVGAAAESYFNKPVNELTLSESALLAGLISAPSDFDPRANPKAAESNRKDVLDEMLQQKRINQSQYADARSKELFLVGPGGKAADGEGDPPANATLVQPLELQSSTQPYFVDYVRRYLVAKYGDDLIYRGGLKVETTLDPRLQGLAEASVSDSLDGTDPPLEMAMVSVEPATGYVKALVGGRDFNASQVNLALGACPEGYQVPAEGPICLAGGGTGRQPGSAFKPFTLAKAFEEGIGPSRVYSGPGSYTVPNCTGTDCTVGNVESGSYGSITLREATVHSVNTVFAQLIGDVGVPETAEMAHRLGITMVPADGIQANGDPYGISLTLGAAEVSPLDMAAAYSVFANRGNQLPATPILKITDAKGQVIEDNTTRTPKRVLSEVVADNVTDVLKGVVASGTGTGAAIGRPDGTAGKTGSADENRDAWFVGFTPTLSTSVWMGYSDTNTRSLFNIKGVSKVYGGTIPASTWKAYMSAALKDTPKVDFPKPAPLAGDVTAGARRAPVDITPKPTEQLVSVAPPVTLFPNPTTTVPTTTFTLPPIFSTTTVPKPTTSTSLNLFPNGVIPNKP
ncbi:MAG: penicillin-binding protein [Actinomycetota bacterium]|nr:penicillin-binding protein [Actinomycetota bacterium]